MSLVVQQEYHSTLLILIKRVKEAQYNSLKSFSREKVLLAWDFGKLINEKLENSNWGDSIIQNLATDLQLEFPGVSGFSYRDLKYMRQFYKFCNVNSIGQPLVAQLSWTSSKVILDKCKDGNEAIFYIQKSIKNGWSKYDLKYHIEKGLYNNTQLAQNNFNNTLEVDEATKAKVAFDFRDDMGIELINGEDPFREKAIEEYIMDNLNKFLLSTDGKYAFVGRQVKLTLNNEEFFVDLMFYHLELNCFIIFELKATKFKPEHLGQLQGYMVLVDKLKRRENMTKTIGILVCKEKSRILVEYMLADTNKPIGVATINNGVDYAHLDDEMKMLLPSEEEITKTLIALIDKN
jgi:predicted nuclease of restriction endonuclease-like (RecB) superfamily